MSKSGKILKICELLNNKIFDRDLPNEYEIINDGDRIGVRFTSDKFYRINCRGFQDERFPFDFSECHSLSLLITDGENIKTLEGLPLRGGEVIQILSFKNLITLKGIPDDTIELELSSCDKLPTLEYLPQSIEKLKLANLDSIRTIDHLPSKQLKSIDIELMRITNLENIDAHEIFISYPIGVLKIDEPIKCSTLTIKAGCALFTNIDGLRDYKGIVKIDFDGKYEFKEFDFSLNGTFEKFEQFLEKKKKLKREN